MAEALVGRNTVREVAIAYAGAPVMGAPVTYSLWGPRGDQLITAQAATSVGSGRYQYEIDGLTYLGEPGYYRERWLSTAVPTAGKDWRADRAFFVTYPTALTTSRLDLRHTVAQLLGDLWTGRNQALLGSNVLYDLNRTEPDDHWQGAYLYVYAGTNRGDARRVTHNSASAYTLTVSQNFSTSPQTDTYYELHQRFTVEEYNRAINLALWQSAQRGLRPVIDESLVQAGDQLEYTVPAHLHAISRVFTGSDDAGWTELERQKGQWQTIPGRRILRLTSATDGARLRLVGVAVPEALADDDSFTDVNPDYLTFKAAAHLVSAAIASPQVDRDAAAQTANFFHAQAEAARPGGATIQGLQRL